MFAHLLQIQRSRRRFAFGMILLLLLSSLGPVAQTAAAQGEPPNCEQGFVVSDDGTTCVPDPNAQQQLDCPEGQVPDQAGTSCVPDPNVPPLECDPGFIPDQTGTSCVPDPNQQPTCGEGEILNQATNTCVPDPNTPLECDEGMVADETGTTCVPDPSQQRAASTIELNLTTWQCDSATEIAIADVDLAWLNANCGAPATPFAMMHTAPNGTATPNNVSGMWGLGTQPIGLHTFSQTLPEGYALQVYCNFRFDTGAETGYQSRAVDVEVGYVQLEILDPVQAVYCDWYNVQATIGEYTPPAIGNIHLTKSNCPLLASLAPETAPYESFRDTCTEPSADVHFEVRQLSGTPLASGDTDASGKLILDVNAPELILIEEHIPPGYAYARAFCAHRLPNEQPVYQPASFIIEGTTTDHQLFETSILDCHWFNIPADPTTIGTIHLTKHTCAEDIEGFDPAAATYEAFLATCPDTTEGIEFFLFEPNTEGPADTRTTDANGELTFGNLTPGVDYGVTEAQQEFETAYAFCAYGSNQSPGTTYDPIEVNASSTIRYTLDGGYLLDCHWFNVTGEVTPTDEDTYDIDFWKYVCPPEVPADADREWYEQNCLPAGGFAFAILGPLGGDTITTDANGFASVPGNPATGGFRANEFLANGYGQPLTWCRVAEWADGGEPGPWEPHDFPNDFNPPEGATRIECHWYNFPPEGDIEFTLTKYACSENVFIPYEQSVDNLLEDCDESRHAGVDFDLVYNGQSHPATTDANGNASWSGLPSGPWSLTETIPPGYGEPIAWCRYLQWPDDSPLNGNPRNYAFANAAISGDFEYLGIVYHCDIFNIPGDTTTVIVRKHLCPEGAAPEATWESYDALCTAPGEGVEFTLDTALDSPTKTTNASGSVEWSGEVPTGPFTLTETVPPGYGEPVWWCASEFGTGFDPIRTGAAIDIELTEQDGEYYCEVFNIPEGEYQLELYKYICDYTVDRTLGLPDLGTHPNCAPAEGVSFTASFGMTPGSARTTDANGSLTWEGIPGGPWSLTEGPMTGSAAPKVYCGPPETTEPPEMTVSDWTITGTLDQANPHLICVWFNFEHPTEHGRITVYKFQCLPGTTATDLSLLQEACPTLHNGIGFTLDGPGGSQSASATAGAVDWTGLEQGDYTVTETTVLPGYLTPIVYCAIVLQDGAPLDPGDYQWLSQPVTDQAIQLTLDNLPKRIVCFWFNIPSDYGEITIYKWTCPAGYDLHAYGADPKVDCTTPQNGVTFTLTPPAGPALQTDTGDSINGAVYFGGLTPGAYTVTESVPPGTASVFVLDCTGTDIPKVHQYPLSWGPKLDINVASGDSIVCHWYNVPKLETGWVTVHKFVCSTTTFVDAVYCVTYERGQAFELFQVTGTVSQGVGITNAGGTYTWSGLEPGAYTIREDKGVPCKMTATNVDGTGNARVVAGAGTTIHVYNCTSTPGKVPPGKVPGKYPNTGVGPDRIDSLLPALQGEQPTAPAGTPSPEEDAFYAVDCIAGAVPEGTPAPSTPAADATMPPIEAEPTAVPPGTTPSPPATPEVEEGECQRGAIPQRLVIDAIGVDAGIEDLEIVDGVMEQPTGAHDVAWYRDTARLGEANNVVMAGHLNWWNVPEGVFYRLQDLEEGDRIAVTGDDGMVYLYEVRTVTQESNLEEPGIDVIGPTDEPTLTLITCGGAWNADIAEYDARTVVRAVQVEVQPAEDAAS